jgi:hypothetical protein
VAITFAGIAMSQHRLISAAPVLVLVAGTVGSYCAWARKSETAKTFDPAVAEAATQVDLASGAVTTDPRFIREIWRLDANDDRFGRRAIPIQIE